MTNIRIVYDPFAKCASVYNEQTEPSAMENKTGTFLNGSPFSDCLCPLRRRCLTREGLLPELAAGKGSSNGEKAFRHSGKK